MSERLVVPGVDIVKRPLHIFFLIDSSTSMKGEKMNAVNQGVPAAIGAVERAMKQHPEVQVFIHVLRFSTDIEWILPREGVQIQQMHWKDIAAGGYTYTGKAINELCEALDVKVIGSRGFPPVCILMSDGFYSDTPNYFKGVIERLNRTPWGIKAIRLAMGIGDSRHYDENSLLQFNNQKNYGVIKIEDYKEIVRVIQWVTVAASVSSTRSKSSGALDTDSNVAVPPMPKVDDIW